MPTSLNKVILMGHVGKDPEIRSFQNGGRVASLTLATSKKYRDKKSGQVNEITEWHRLSIFNDALIALAEKFIRKGTRLYVEGALETRKWKDKEGAEKYSTEITLRPYNGELIILTWQDGKAADTDEVQDAPGDLGEALPA